MDQKAQLWKLPLNLFGSSSWERRIWIDGKCHQLCSAIVFALACKESICPLMSVFFYEGWITNKTQYNMGQQYNSYWFLVLGEHNDKGIKVRNPFIVEKSWHLPSTQNAGINSIISSDISNDYDDMWEIYMENWYSVSSLLF